MPTTPSLDITLDDNGAVEAVKPNGGDDPNEWLILHGLSVLIAERSTDGKWSKDGRTFKAKKHR